MVAEPVCAAPAFAAAVSVTVPLPVPDAPLETVSHDGVLLVAVHEHQLPVVTATDVVPPFAVNDALVGEIV